METLLKASEADWALAKRRERVLSKLAASKECLLGPESHWRRNRGTIETAPNRSVDV